MLSILVAYLIAVGAFAVLIGFVVPQIYKSITEIANQAPVWYENIRNWFTEFEEPVIKGLDKRIKNKRNHATNKKW